VKNRIPFVDGYLSKLVTSITSKRIYFTSIMKDITLVSELIIIQTI